MLIDLHVHTSQYSPCSAVSCDEVIQAGIGRRLAGLVITEHDYLWKSKQLQELQARYKNIKIYRGMEVTTAGGDHFLVYGVVDHSWIHWGIGVGTLIRGVKQKGGAIIYAHPYRYSQTVPSELFWDPPHALEFRSSNIEPRLYGKIKTLAKRLGISLTAASDAHSMGRVGCYATCFPILPSNERELADLIKTGKFQI